MSTFLQVDAIFAVRQEIADEEDGKIVFEYSPLLGLQDGANKDFQIPQSRIVASSLKVFKNKVLLVLTTDYVIINAKTGEIQFVAAPKIEDEITVTFLFTWFIDTELDRHLNRSANDMGFATYHTGSKTVSGSETTDILSDMPNGLKGALILGGAYHAAKALVSRLAVKYDISAGDHSYTPSQMADKYDGLTEKLWESFKEARDAFYQGQGRQFQPSIETKGYVLPSITPKR